MSKPDLPSLQLSTRFSRQLKEAFPRLERGPHGEPSRTDFIDIELTPAKVVIAGRFFELDELIPGRPDYRTYTVAGLVVPLFTIHAQLSPERNVIELVELLLELDPPDTFWITTD